MEKISNKTYKELIEGAKPLTQDLYGDKVLKLQDGRIAKLFRLKRVLSSALLWPYAKRFVRGTKILQKHNIPTVEVTDLFKIPSVKRDIVIYNPLEGESLRDMIKKTEDPSDLISDFAQFFAYLHDKGIYFRAIHFNNVFITPENKFGLIDISDLYYSYLLPMSISKRVRNFKPIFNYNEDREALESFSLDKFLRIYCNNLKIQSNKKHRILKNNVLQLYDNSFAIKNMERKMAKVKTIDSQSDICPLCKSIGTFSHQGRDLLYDKKELYTYMKCTQCGAVYQHPMPDSKTISSFYPDVYYEEINKKKYSMVKQSVLRYKYNYSHIKVPFYLKILAPIVSLFYYKSSIPYKPDSKGLDIGCSNGQYISSMNTLGWQFEGVEFNSVAVTLCRKAGIKVFHGELRSANFKDNSFDIVSARHLIEHIPDPNDIIKEISRLLKPGGRLVIITPNSNALGRKWFGLNWFPDEIPRHLILFNKKNLNLIARKHNLHPTKIKTFSTPRALLHSIDYLIWNRKKPSNKSKFRRFFAKFFVVIAKVLNRGEELFIIYEKQKPQ
jgi:SAM-dependent methyltransferase